ncbi:hypothetical protein BDR04DRAFT_1095094 [Suillus decipiens]|nr:hypothetical protein BDR04DRAFT_1095094 [Suillus decipiens]
MSENPGSYPYPNTADRQTPSYSHYTQPSVCPWTSGNVSNGTGHNNYNFTTQGQNLAQSVSKSTSQILKLAIPPQIAHSYSDVLLSIPNYDSWNDAPTFHSDQHCSLASGGTGIIRHFSSSAVGSGYSSSSMVFPNGDSSWTTMSPQPEYTVAGNTPFVFDPNASTSHFSPYNTLPHQWQTHAVSQLGAISFPFIPMIHPPLTAEESSQPTIKFITQPRASRGEQMGYPSNQPSINQPRHNSSLLHSHPSTHLLSCRWLNGDAVTHCEFTGTLGALRLHCKTIHFTGSNDAQIECRWEGCEYYKRDDPTVRVMRRGCLWRHILEVHLRMKRGGN